MAEDTFRVVITAGVAIAAISIVIIAIVAVGIGRTMWKLHAKISGVADSAEPLLDTACRLVEKNGPKISSIVTSAEIAAENAKDISAIAKDQAERFAEVGRDVADRTRAQVARVDAVVDGTVEQAQNLGHNVKIAAMKPVREASGVVAGIRAGMAAYAQGRRPDVTRVTQDEEMFI